MKYYIIAGEASGDLYGSQLMAQLKSIDSDANFRFWGGPRMEAQSSGQLKSIKETAFMGFLEVAANIFVIKELFRFAKYSIKEYNPDVVILLDYPGFNLRMLEWAKKEGYKDSLLYIPSVVGLERKNAIEY